MEGVAAIDDAWTPGRGAREFDSRLNGFRPGIGEEHLVEVGHECQQALGQETRQCRHTHLHQIGQLAVEHGLERFGHRRVITADGEHAPPGEQIEIPLAVLVVQILAGTTLVALIEPNGFEHMHHLLIEMACMQLVALDLPLGDKSLDIKAHSPPRHGMGAARRE